MKLFSVHDDTPAFCCSYQKKEGGEAACTDRALRLAMAEEAKGK